jgi:asparagine synthase (glutamine-hydrolysing)
MCGISGFVTFGVTHGATTQEAASTTLRRMTDRLAHRGPDAAGLFHHENVHLGHRRLSVIDISASTQPMTTADGRYTIVYNGEIYNFKALGEELRILGRHFRTNGDTEVVLQAVAEWGDAALSKLQGMFAFACWDHEKKSLFVARDHVGVKPLYFSLSPSAFVFASELKSVMAHPAVSAELDLNALSLFLECQYIPAPHTIYQGVKKLDAAHAMRLNTQTSEMHTWKYWQPDYQQKIPLDETTSLALLEEALSKSVQSMLVSDVPLGAFVSGGVDSSLVAAMMTKLSGKPVETFNLGFLEDDGSANQSQSEHDEAAAVAKHIGAQHHPLMVRSRDVASAFEEWVNVFDEPFGDQAALPTMLLSKLTRQHVTVALTGEGADELFSGYSNYAKRTREERISAVLGAPSSPLPPLLRALPATARKDRLIKAITQPKNERYATIPNVFDIAVQKNFFSPALQAAQTSHIAHAAARFYDECNANDYIERLMYIDMKLWLPDDLLTKVDRATMAYSLEARVPYLDHCFIEFTATLPAALKQNGKTTKYLLKKLAAKYLPHDIVYRPKQGFVMPLSEWLEGELKPHVNHALGSSGLAKRGLFQRSALSTLLAQHKSGHSNHAGRIWALTVLEQWFRRYAPDFSL